MFLDLYKDDFSRLYCLLKPGKREKDNEKNGRESEIHNVHRTLVSLKKKVETKNLIERYIDMGLSTFLI